MRIETERKFLVLDDGYKAEAVESHRIRQGYIAHDSGRSVRVRIRDDKGFLTIKGPFLGEVGRPEWEKEIPLQEAEDLFLLCKPGSVDKTRWIVPAGIPGQAGDEGNALGGDEGHARVGDEGGVMAGSDRPSRSFEVDEFHGDNEGLVLAEIELADADESFMKPSWLGREVTDDGRYYNGYLARNPFKNW